MDSYYLVADIGGTKSELAVYAQKEDLHTINKGVEGAHETLAVKD